MQGVEVGQGVPVVGDPGQLGDVKEGLGEDEDHIGLLVHLGVPLLARQLQGLLGGLLQLLRGGIPLVEGHVDLVQGAPPQAQQHPGLPVHRGLGQLLVDAHPHGGEEQGVGQHPEHQHHSGGAPRPRPQAGLAGQPHRVEQQGHQNQPQHQKEDAPQAQRGEVDGGGVELGDVPQLTDEEKVLDGQGHRGDQRLKVAAKHHDGGGDAGDDGPHHNGAGEKGENPRHQPQQHHRAPKPAGEQGGGDGGHALVDNDLGHQGHHQGVEQKGDRQHHLCPAAAAEQGLPKVVCVV